MPLELDPEATYTVEMGLNVADAQASLRFYRDTLGFEVTGIMDLPYGYVWGMRLGTSFLKIAKYDEVPTAKNPSGKAVGYRHITIHVQDVEKDLAKCEEAGYQVEVPLTRLEAVPGKIATCYFAMVLDPDGNRVELCEGFPWVTPA